MPLFVIRLEGVEADSDTSALISSLGLDVTWITVPASEVRSAVALSFGDQIVRAWRGKPGRERSGSLEDIGRWSRARCIASWMATGMTRPEALAFADDLSVGRPPDEVRTRPEHPLCVIVGDAGSGKSLTGERLLQEAVADSIGDPDAPIPVWLRARDVNDNLTASIAQACEGVGNPQRQGVFVVIDGVDEIGSGARTVLNEARATVEALPGARIVITSRPLPDFERIEETVRLPVLSSEQSLSLIESIVQRRVTGHQWPAAISEAIRRPFYALLLADWLRRREGLPNGPGDMLRGLLEQATPAEQVQTNALLRKLARMSTDRGDAPVVAAEIGSPDELTALRESRLVVEQDGRVGFALPIYTQWYAAQCVTAHEVEIGELLEDPSRIDLWRYALVIAVGQLPFDSGSELLERLVDDQPGLASQIIAEAVREYEQPEQAATLDIQSVEAAQRIQRASSAWLQGLQPLSPLLPFSNLDGTPLPLGAAVDGASLYTVRRTGDHSGPQAFELPKGEGLFSFGPGSGTARMSRPAQESAWPWRWALHDVAQGVKQWVSQMLLPTPDGPLFEEAAWSEALVVTGRGSLTPIAISLDEIEERLSQLPDRAMLQDYRRTYDLRALRKKIQELRASGAGGLAPPWPAADLESHGGWVWDPYSPEQLLARTSAVYEGALRGYRQLVEGWFPRVASRLTVFATLPASVRGILFFDKGVHDFGGGPVLQWLLYPVAGEGDTASVSLRQEQGGFFGPELTMLHQEASEQLRVLRPHGSWIQATAQGTVLEVFDAAPATKLAYGMLHADLKRIHLSA